MSKVSKFIKCLLVILTLLSIEIRSANAFFLIPPMPWDIEVNIPGNANKIISNIKSYHRQLQALKTKQNTELLKSVKIGEVSLNEILNKNLKALIPSEEIKKGINKTVGKAGVKFTGLDIDTSSGEEKAYYDAYYKLFFLLPEKDSYSGNYNILETAFAEKRLDYQQDMIVDTYLFARMSEDFLVLVNKTVDRLDRCRIGELKDDKCIFFGMQYVYSDPEKEAPLGTEDQDPGSLGENMNAYIVSTVYDRMLRIVEDLTAMEAMYRSAKQIDLVEPIKSSSLETASSSKLQFAYKTTHTYSYAKLDYNDYQSGSSINSKKSRSQECKGDADGCATINETSTPTASLDETEILSKLQPIDVLLAKVMGLHNLKKELPEYKDEYRKYLKSIENHKRALKVLGESDNCVQDFLNRHGGSGREIWLGGSALSAANDHNNRAGLSRELIEKYQQYITDKILDTTTIDPCEGFYPAGSCPIGYRSDDNPDNACPEDPSKLPCIVDSISTDIAIAEQDAQNNTVTNSDDSDTDGFLDAPNADDIENDNRMKAERSWRIGSDAVIELTKKGILEFKPWKDQQNIQKEYLRNKYRNTRIIIKTTDKAVNSYRVGKTLAENRALNPSEEPIDKLLKKVTSVKTPEEAVADGSAVKYAIEQLGLCPGFSFNGSIGVKTITTTYTVPKTCSGKNKDGDTYYYSCPQTKHGSMQLKCTASVSGSISYVDIKQENYKYGTKNSYDTPTITTQAVDLRIKNDPGLYPADLSKAPSSIDSLLALETKRCPASSLTWNFTIHGIVKDFLPVVLGGCKEDIELEQKYLYDTAKAKGRTIAKDLLENVIAVRIAKEKWVKEELKKDQKKVEELEAKRKGQIQSLNTWTTLAKQYTDKKNNIATLKNESDKRLIAIENEISGLEERIKLVDSKKSEYGTMAKDSEAMARQEIALLTMETNCILGGGTFCKSSANYKKELHAQGEYDLAKILSQYEGASRINCDVTDKECIEKNEASICTSFAEKQLKTLGNEVDKYNTYINNMQENIKATEAAIEQAKNKLADNYVKNSEEAQTAIEEENEKYERFVIEKDERMTGKETCSGWGPFKSCKQFKGDDGLEKTITEILDPDKKFVRDYAKEKIEEIWFSSSNLSNIASQLSSLGVPSKFKIGDADVDLGFGIKLASNHTYTSITELVEELKDKISTVAASQIEEIVKKSDKIMTEEIEAAVEEVNEWSGKKLCLPGEGEAETAPYCVNDQNTANSAYDYMKPKNYDGGSITSGHMDMIEQLKLPTPANAGILAMAGMELKEIFGIIPNITTDKEYFVALPARGLEKGKSSTCTYDTENSHDNDGCDYMAPREPLSITPPLREIFYFSALDHDDIPSIGKSEVGADEVVKNPSIANLLLEKHPEEGYEYLPEVWRYTLARPNLRNDGKYQQSFIERGYKQEEVIKYLKEFKDNEVNTTLSRGGIYPCILSGAGIADVSSSSKIKNVKIGKGGPSSPVMCQEVVVYKKSYLQHLLADFKENVKDKKNPALIGLGSSGGEPLYECQSELAQFLAPDGKKKLKYRPLLRSTFALLKEEASENSNNFTRQMAETTSFKRNVMGSFLENVNSEFNARKNMDNAKEDIKKTLTTLCEQIHQYGKYVGNEYDLEGDAKTEACANQILSTSGLAKSSDDKDYSGSGSTYYDELFKNFEAWKNKELNQAYSELQKVKTEYKNKGLDKVDERIKEIEDLIEAFGLNVADRKGGCKQGELGDPNEYAQLTPGDDCSTAYAKAKEAKAEREITLQTVEEAILSMDNQTRAVAYCPIY